MYRPIQMLFLENLPSIGNFSIIQTENVIKWPALCEPTVSVLEMIGYIGINPLLKSINMVQKEQVIEAIKQVYDPEIPVDIYELGLIYEITILPLNNIEILMTLTSPNCPAADIIPSQVEEKIKAIEGVHEVTVHLTFEPAYTMDRMSEAAKLELGFA